MFFGEYHHQLDEKCRLRIPAKLKDQLGDNPFIARGPNNSLFVLPKEAAERMLEEKFKGVDIIDPYNNVSLRLLTSSAFFADEDKQGRIVMPSKLLEHAKMKQKGSDEIDRNIVIIGVFNRIEIWSRAEWEKYSDIDSEEYDMRLAETLNLSKNNTKEDKKEKSGGEAQG